MAAEETAIRAALGALIAEGLVPYNVGMHGEPLVALDLVQAEMPAELRPSDDARYEQAAAKALITVLGQVVDEIKSRNYRIVLRHVLPLIEDLLGEDVTHRRKSAAEALKPGKGLKAGSVRTHYEGKALNQLASDLCARERVFAAATN